MKIAYKSQLQHMKFNIAEIRLKYNAARETASCFMLHAQLYILKILASKAICSGSPLHAYFPAAIRLTITNYTAAASCTADACKC
jgi:hypothetical protein